MEIRHFPPAGQSLIEGHSTNGGTCICKPERKVIYKQTARGRFGRHQGNTIAKIEWRHNVIERKQEEPRAEGDMFLFADDRAFVAREDAQFRRQAETAARMKALTDAMPNTLKLSA